MGDEARTLTAVPGGTVEEVESALAGILADLIGREVPPDADFFADLGANSLSMAHFCARVRKRGDLPKITIRDVYGNPSVRALATAVVGPDLEPAGQAALPAPEPAPVVAPASTARVAVCGAAQLLIFFAYCSLLSLSLVGLYGWLADASGPVESYVRAVVLGTLLFAGMTLLPVAAKWLLVGRWTVTDFPVWGAAYLRFWTVKTLLSVNPMVAFVGSPLYVLYLRALGARVGRGVTILSRHVPVCTDLLTVGDGAVVRKDSLLLCYRAHAGRIETGRVTIGSGAFVGERAVLEIGTAVGDHAQLGHTSALLPGQAVPAGERWHGSPARPCDVDYVRVEPRSCGSPRRAAYATLQLAQLLLVLLPLPVAAAHLLFTEVGSLEKLLHPTRMDALTSGEIFVTAFVVSVVGFFGALVAGLAFVGTVPRALGRLLVAGRTYPLYGFHYSVHRLVTRTTNLPFFRWLFGDSSYIVPYLAYVGYRMPDVEQTGSNFGIEVRHENPYLATIGSGTMVADGLSLANADYTSSSFRLAPVEIGGHNFLGNHVVYPSGGRTGENCLLGTKVMVPLDGPVRTDVGLLGSPCFEIPRTVDRDRRFDSYRIGTALRDGLAAKNRYNLRTMAVFLLTRWVFAYVLTLLTLLAVELHGPVGELVIAAAMIAAVGLGMLYFVFLERLTMRFGRLQPRLCSIYDPYFWWHERLWKLTPNPMILNGTPYKNVVWRLLGMRIGRGVFDDGCDIVERTLVSVGAGTTLGALSVIQPHSQEDGTFKSDYVRIGDGCTIGTGALVHYGVTMGDGSVLAADAFLMKGEDVPPGARWAGNPATERSHP